MKKIFKRKMMAKLMIAFLFCTMLLLPAFDAKATDFTVTIKLSETSHGDKMTIVVEVDTSPKTESFSKFVVNVTRNGSHVDTLTWQDSENRNITSISHPFTSNFTILNSQPSEQVLSFDCSIYSNTGAMVGSGSASKEPPIIHVNQAIDPTSATCTEPGYNNQQCSICGYITKAEIAGEPALGHQLSPLIAHDDTTSGSQSKHYKQCLRTGCNYREMSSCNFGKPFSLPASCMEAAQQLYLCNDCHYQYIIESGMPLGHNFQRDTARDTAPTCTATGLEAYTCSRCGQHDDITLAMLGHDYLSVVTMPTCTSGGYTTYTCSRCGDTHTSDEITALGHDFQRDPARDNTPTCTSAGLEAYTCSNCGQHDDITLAMLGYDYLSVVTMPTCTSGGFTTYTCSRCGDTHTSDEITALGHDFQRDPARDNALTCTSAGLEAYTCSNCGQHDDVTLPMLGHDYLPIVTEPACTSDGYTTHTCSRCGDSYTDNHTKKRGHWFGKWIPQGDGTHTADCIREGCSYTKTAPCRQQTYTVNEEEISFCPICGETPTGECLQMIRDANTKAITNTLPNGELIVRRGILPNGTRFVSIAFERSGDLKQPEGRVQFTLPLKAFEGYSLKLLNPDGSLMDVPGIITEEGLTFELDFTPLPGSVSLPTALIQLFPMIY